MENDDLMNLIWPCKEHFCKNRSLENNLKKIQRNVNIGVEPQFNLCPESEPQGIQLILLEWEEEALLHSFRTWTWTYKC